MKDLDTMLQTFPGTTLLKSKTITGKYLIEYRDSRRELDSYGDTPTEAATGLEAKLKELGLLV